jgi:hypothetical protein
VILSASVLDSQGASATTRSWRRRSARGRNGSERPCWRPEEVFVAKSTPMAACSSRPSVDVSGNNRRGSSTTSRARAPADSNSRLGPFHDNVYVAWSKFTGRASRRDRSNANRSSVQDPCLALNRTAGRRGDSVPTPLSQGLQQRRKNGGRHRRGRRRGVFPTAPCTSCGPTRPRKLTVGRTHRRISHDGGR